MYVHVTKIHTSAMMKIIVGMLRLLEGNFHNSHECHVNIITWKTF